MTNIERVIQKVQKALALANDKKNHAEESETALLLAQKLLAKHNLSIADVQSFGDVGTVKKEVVEGDATHYTRLQWWVKILHGIIASNFRCYSLRYLASGKSKLVFVGTKEDVEVAIAVYKFAEENIRRHANHYVSSVTNSSDRTYRNSIRNDYIGGYLSGLKAKFEEQVKNEGWGLVLVKDKEVVDYYENIGARKSKTRTSASFGGDPLARSQGYSDGKSFDQNRKYLA